MKLYATTTSERATKGQGGNEYLNIDININGGTPTFRARIINDELLAIVYVSFEAYHFGKWKTVYQDEVFFNLEATKGEKKKGENQITK